MDGTQTLEHPGTRLPPPEDVIESPQVPPSEPEGGRRWPIFAVVAGIVLALVAGAVGGRMSLQSRVDDLTADRDTLSGEVADLEAEQNRLFTSVEDLEAATEQDAVTIDELAGDLAAELSRSAALDEDKAALTAELAAEGTQVSVMTAANAELRATLEEARQVAEAIALMELNFDSSMLDDYSNAGGDLTSYEGLLVQLDRGATLEEWAASWDDHDGAWRQADVAILDTGDAALIDSWSQWNRLSAQGGEEEWLANAALWARSYYLLLERLPALGT